jgi:Chromosome segregation protein Csm1/Pcs1
MPRCTTAYKPVATGVSLPLPPKISLLTRLGLHFKLLVAPEENAPAYDDVEFQYEPRLDRDRDQDLIDIMPDYLSEEISFSRGNAAKFYSRIADTLTKRLIHD